MVLRAQDRRSIPEGSPAALSEGPGEAGHTWLPGVSSGPPGAPPLSKRQRAENEIQVTLGELGRGQLSEELGTSLHSKTWMECVERFSLVLLSGMKTLHKEKCFILSVQ